MEDTNLVPQYVVLHDNVGGVLNKGDTVPQGTFDEEQLARLVGLGAIGPANTAAESMPQSADEFKARAETSAVAAVSGDTLAALDLEDTQRDALASAGYTSADSIRLASDDELMAVPGIGPKTVDKLRAGTGG